MALPWRCALLTTGFIIVKNDPPAIKKLTICRPADISPALYLTGVQLLNNWKVAMVVTDGLASADLQPPWWRGPVGLHDDVIKWKHFLRYWPFVRGIHRSLVNSPNKGHWRGALLNKRLSKQSWGWWLETTSHSLWRRCNGLRPYCRGDPTRVMGVKDDL